MQKELLKILNKHSDKLNMNKRMLFIQFVEMAYQFVNTESYLSKFRNAEQAFSEFYQEYLKQVMKQPFKDILGELMTEIDMLDTGSKSKLCQNLTPQTLSDNSVLFLGKFETKNEVLRIGDICVGSGALILSHFKEYLKQNIHNKKPKPVIYLLNDKDCLMCKVCVIQLEVNNLFINRNKIPMLYQVFNHDAITEYKHFALNIEPEKQIVVGCSDRELITDKNIIAGYREYKCKLSHIRMLETFHKLKNEVFKSSETKRKKECQQA
ncbi:hypothetical protein KW496_19510 [Vibrio fluvialis]|nr:hypothetical protein [Vibrio fluvialis]